MAKRTRFEDYRDRYACARLEKSDEQILLVTLHTDDGEFVWDMAAHDDVAALFSDIAGDRDLTAVILTGSGVNFMDHFGAAEPGRELPVHQDLGAERLDDVGWTGTQLFLNLLDVQVPMIAAVHGACTVHAELPVMCDLVLASDDACFQDSVHFARGVVPGDGSQIVWPMVLGRNRGRYFLLTGQKLTAQEAMAYGAVNEVVPRDGLLARAWELARELALRPPLTLRLTRSVLVQELRRAAADDLALGVYEELYAMRNFLSWRRGNEPLDRPWDQEPWSD
ncbi:MAG TPA: enoyl-CoA hydratase/isomerase family protein [Acidimicrobiia bacterium]|jgi:enoyl-CoA hydratase/carnithine racemase